MTYIAACHLAALLRYRWARRRLVERALRHFTGRRRATRIARHIP